ncbi:sugar kinase [Izhakiella australiensis]|uniref:Sugar kinase n=1 Tax=Izhakiella australiensis TaxID=1926881 RepID=A0A1S8YSH6_9GAMM|nr:sugar kinase [Izhakiella australiensis]OON42099.1 sugar kinase [Izhakiella australiensis]
MYVNLTLAPDELGPTITIGEILVEIMAKKQGEGFSEPLDLTGPYPSGAPAIFIDQCAKISGNAGMIGSVGDDDFGRVNIERLKKDGVDTSAITIDPLLPTGSAFVRYRNDGARDFVFNISTSAAGNIIKNRESESLIASAGHIHIMGTVLSIPGAWPLIEYAVEKIKRRGGTLSLDPNVRKEIKSDSVFSQRLSYLLSKTDLLLPSDEEILIVADTDDFDAALKYVFSAGVKEVVLKQGRDGATCYHHSGSVNHCSAFEVTEIDPTGAGDCFGGAYVGCLRLGMSTPQALVRANAAGARNVQFIGPMEGSASLQELEMFITDTPRRTGCK